MSKLDELIANLCPDGVEYQKLEDIASIDRGVRVVRSQLSTEDGYPVFQNSLTPLGFYDKYNCPENVPFVISAGAAGDVGYSTSPFWAADDCLYILGNEAVDNRYIYHALLWKQSLIYSRVRKASIPRLSRTVIEGLRIPIPPLEVQREIVRVLDNFTFLSAELSAELSARRKQYEYYLERLMSTNDYDVEWMTIDECTEKTSNIKWKTTTGQYRYIDLSSVDRETCTIGETTVVDSTNAPSRAQQIIHEDDVLFGTTRPLLKRFCIVPVEYDGQIASTGYCVLRPKKNCC